MKKILALFFALMLLQIGCGKKQGPNLKKAILTFVLGEVVIKTEASRRKAKKGDTVLEGSTLITGKKSVAILEVGDKNIQIEIQSGSEFTISSLGKTNEVQLKRGNAWTWVQKFSKDEEFYFKTATTVAAIRGTKFYTFHMGDITGTCHCQGKVMLGNLISKKFRENNEDYMAFHRGGKTVYLTGEEAKKANIPYQHNHSEITDSPMGKKFNLNREEVSLMMNLVQKKFAELK